MKFESITLGQLLEKRALEFKNQTYLIFNDREISYGELDQTVNRVVNGLVRIGVKKGTHVNLHLQNCPEFLYTVFALAKIGAVLNPTNLNLTGNELGYIIGHADAQISITSTAFKDLIMSCKAVCKNLEKIVVIGETHSNGDTICWDEILENAPADFTPGESVRVDDTFVIMYTSGTTALPKGVMLSHENIISAGYSWMWAAGFTPKDRTLTGFPLFHANALYFSCIGSMAHGGSFVLLEKLSITGLMDDCRKNKVTHFNFSGPMMGMMLGQSEDPKDCLNPVRVVHCAIGNEELIGSWCQRYQIEAVMAYNLTECPLATTTPISGPNPVKLGSIGWPAPSVPFPTQVRVVDSNGNDAPAGVTGEIIVRSPALMKGYYKDTEKTAETVKDGWLYTGDAGWCDPDGCLWFSDRIKDVIKVKGENVSSLEVEDVIAAHPKVAEVAVIAVGHAAKADQEVLATIVLAEGESAQTVPPEQIIELCNKNLAKFKVPRYYDYRDKPIPRIIGGKVSKKDIRKERQDLTRGCYDLRKEKWL